MNIQLKKHTESIFKLAHEFVAVREQTNKTAGTFRSLFYKINFQNLHDSAIDIEGRIKEKAIIIQDFKKQEKDIADETEKHLTYIVSYLEALKEATYILTQKLNLLTLGAQNKRSLRWTEFNAICKEERVALERCQKTGDSLTKLYSKL